jgi:hypothetical protein
MKNNIIKTVCAVFLIVSGIVLISIQNQSNSEQILQGYIQKVPENFYGTWRVKAKRIETDSPETFKEKTIDLWNISTSNNVIKLCNPFSGAEAEIFIDASTQNSVEFTKSGKYDNKNLTDKVNISIQGDSFTGIDTLRLDTISDVDGSIRKSVTAKYSIKGERLSGQSIK